MNAYHQPGVESGKKAAARILELQAKVLSCLRDCGGTAKTVKEIAKDLGQPDAAETIHHILEHAAANVDHGLTRTTGATPFDGRFGIA